MGCGIGILLIIPLFVIVGVLYFLFPGANPWVIAGGGFVLYNALLFVWLILSAWRAARSRAIR